ncbi:MAG: ABC transporter permease [Acetatifactor sp.]|nr:ABC transporter permease [Acetatifactor sp.]
MRLRDLLRMSSSNLWKRKVRTILTVLGVVIGVAAIVVMVSLGLGLSKSLTEQYESYGSLTQVTVNPSWGSGPDGEEKRLDDKLVERIKQMEHVESVETVLEISALAKYGKYEGYLQIRGVPKETMESMNIEIGEGKLPSPGEPLSFFYGNQVLQNFYDTKGNDGEYWETGILPDINLMKDPIFIIFDTEAYYNSQGITDNENPVPKPKKYLIPASGVEAASQEGRYSQYGWYTLCDLDSLVQELRKVFKNKPIPGQPTTKTGKPYKEIFYTNLYVNVDDMEHVVEVQKQIADMGYDAYSNAEWLESEQKTMGYVQAILGGIGAVSLLVAAIGIANTMMMSIYERTKEIGVMKVLGCDMRNIQTMFLMEAGFIGLIGGTIGLLISFILSFVINKLASAANEYMKGISYIPLGLVVLALGFAVLVGMLAGYFPSRRAMKLSPLAAIRNE